MTRPVWTPAYVGVGSNLGDRAGTVRAAMDALARQDGLRVYARSDLVESPPVDGSAQPDYINAVVAVLTRHDAAALLACCHAIERRMGRTRDGARWQPRTLDLDLLVFGQEVIDEPGLRVPHPRLAERAFVLGPLAQIAPHLSIPGVGRARTLARDASLDVLRPVAA